MCGDYGGSVIKLYCARTGVCTQSVVHLFLRDVSAGEIFLGIGAAGLGSVTEATGPDKLTRDFFNAKLS